MMARSRSYGSILAGFILAVSFYSPAIGQPTPWLPPEEEKMPPGIINVALPDFGDMIGGGDYGLANHIPIEVVDGVKNEDKTFTPLGGGALSAEGGKIQGNEESNQQIRIVRTPVPLRYSRHLEARFQVKVGDTRVVYFWIECPPVGGKWDCTITTVYPDGSIKEIFRRNLRPDGVTWTSADPRTILDIKLSSNKEAFKLNKRFIFTVSPTQIFLWRDLLPFPNRSLID